MHISTGSDCRAPRAQLNPLPLIALTASHAYFSQGSLLWRISNETRAFVGILRLLLTVLAAAHYATCIWWYMQRAMFNFTPEQLFAALHEGELDSWAAIQYPHIIDKAYILSMHATLMLFGGNTNDTLPQWQEKVTGSFTMLAGTVITAVIVSQVSVLMATLSASDRQYVHKLSQVNVTMEKLMVPPRLRSRVMDYYSYLWARYGTFDVRNNFNLSSEMSTCLNSEISIFFHRRMVTRVPIFRRSSPRVVQAVITHLAPEIYVAGDFIVRAGTRNTAMYFIRDGRCSVLLDDSNFETGGSGSSVLTRVNTLRRNQHFGELSLLADGHKATAHIVADTNVDLHALYKDDFENIKRDFPELLADLLMVVEKQAYGSRKGAGLGAVHKAFNSVQMQLARFTSCTSSEAQAIVDACAQVHFSGGDQIVTMGQRSPGIYFVIDGSCELTVPSLHEDGEELLGNISAGEFFGDLSTINGGPASANVSAGTAIVMCHVLYLEDFEVLKLTYPDISQHLQITDRRQKYSKLSPFLVRPRFFVGLEKDVTQAILNLIEQRFYQPGQTIVEQDKPFYSLVFILRGEADISCGHARIVAFKGAPGHASEYALFSSGADRLAQADEATCEHATNKQQRIQFNTASESSTRPVGQGGWQPSSGAAEQSSIVSSLPRSAPLVPTPPPSPPGLEISISRLRRASHDHNDASSRGSSSPTSTSEPQRQWFGASKGRFCSSELKPFSRHGSFDEGRANRNFLSPLARYSSTAPVPSQEAGGRVTRDSRTSEADTEGEQPTEAEKVLKVLRPGDAIGEECLLKPGTNATMGVHARAQGCDTCSLSSANFESVARMFPALQAHVVSRTLHNASGFSDLSLCAFLSLKVPLFEDAELEMIQEVVSALTIVKCTEQQQLIKRGTSAAGLFLVHSGECDCLIPDPEDPSSKKCVATRIPGQHFGELSLLDPTATTAADVMVSKTSKCEAYISEVEMPPSSSSNVCASSRGASSSEAQTKARPAAIVLLLTPMAFQDICLRHRGFKGKLLSSVPAYGTYNLFYHMDIFKDAENEFLLALVKAVKKETHDAGAVLQTMGEHSTGKGIFFVQQGQLLATSPQTKPVTISQGGYFGLESLPADAKTLDASNPPLQHVQAHTDVELYVLSVDEATRLAASFPYLVEIGTARRKALKDAVALESPSLLASTMAAGSLDNSGLSGSHIQSVDLNGGSGMDADLLSQRLALMQATVVANGRDMRSRIEVLERNVSEIMDRRHHELNTAMKYISARLDGLGHGSEHLQRSRSSRAGRVAFAACTSENRTLEPMVGQTTISPPRLVRTNSNASTSSFFSSFTRRSSFDRQSQDHNSSSSCRG